MIRIDAQTNTRIEFLKQAVSEVVVEGKSQPATAGGKDKSKDKDNAKDKDNVKDNPKDKDNAKDYDKDAQSK